jgi:phytoene synthase
MSFDETPADDLDGLVRRVDPDRWISSRFVADSGLRGDLVALYAFDHELARAPRLASNPLIAEMRLTWWSEALDEIFEGRPVRRHPTAQALAATARARGVGRAPLEALIEARFREIAMGAMDEQQARAWADDTGGALAELVAGLLDPGVEAGLARAAGSAWALGRRGRRPSALGGAFEQALREARRAVRGLSPAAFPAVAHAALAGRPGRSELAKRLRVTWAVARGRI